MDDADETADSDKAGHKRAVKYTHKALEERLNTHSFQKIKNNHSHERD